MAFLKSQNLSRYQTKHKLAVLLNRITNNHITAVTKIIVSVILLFVGVAVLFTIHICVKSGFMNQGGGAEDQRTVQTAATKKRCACGLSVEDLKMIPWFDYKEGENGETCDVDCAVCLESFKVGENCRLLPSFHLFHLECVDLWLMKKPFCPVCRASVRPMKKNVIGDQSKGSRLGADELV